MKMKEGVLYKATPGTRFQEKVGHLRWKFEDGKIHCASINDHPYIWRTSYYNCKLFLSELEKGNFVEASSVKM